MRHLQPVPRTEDVPQPDDAVTVVSRERRRVLYIEGEASLEVITAALQAWGLRVRAERERQQDEPAADDGRGAEGSAREEAGGVPAWVTMRPALPRINRLENILSPLWFPARRPINPNEPLTAFSWFGRAA